MRRRGFSFAEVMVASLILSLLFLIGLFLTQFARKTGTVADARMQAFRQGSQAVARLRRELRGAEIVAPLEGEAGELRFRYPQVEEGLLVVDSLGFPVWEGEARIYLEEDRLLLEKPVGGEVQLMARLSGGTFKVEAGEEFFWFTVESKKAETSSVDFRRKFRLFRETVE